jgi:membrane fusion protein, multidrug efflux system
MPVIFLIFILTYNKSKLEADITKEKTGVHSVAVEQMNSGKMNSKLNYIGLTEAQNDIELISETAGKVEKVFIENGSRVSNNTIIAQVDDQILQANFKLAEAALDKAKLDLSRFENLLKEGNISANDLENSRIAHKNAEAQFVLAKKYLSNASIQSPINGIIVSRYVNVGSTVSPGTSIANTVDISKLKIKISVPEKDIAKIKIGQTASAIFDFNRDKIFEAKVKSISVKADESHNFLVELSIDNPQNILSAGMYAKVEFDFTSQENVLSIPRISLMGSIKNPKVFVVQNNKAFQREIFIGDDIKSEINKLNRPAGIKITYENDLEAQDEAFGSMALAFIAAILFVYLILVALYNSFIYPLSVLLTIPLAIIGALYGLALTMKNIDVMSLLGMIILVGLVGKNVILLVDRINQNRGAGMELKPEINLMTSTNINGRQVLMSVYS